MSGDAPEDAPTDADGPTGRPSASRRPSRLPDGRYTNPDYRILTQSEMIATNTPSFMHLDSIYAMIKTPPPDLRTHRGGGVATLAAAGTHANSIKKRPEEVQIVFRK